MAHIGQDLAKIRKKQEKSLQDIYSASKIPISVLQSIENGSIFTEIKVNKTMIRSNVRSFARVLKLNDDEIIDALNRLENEKDSSILKQDEEGLSKETKNESVAHQKAKAPRKSKRTPAKKASSVASDEVENEPKDRDVKADEAQKEESTKEDDEVNVAQPVEIDTPINSTTEEEESHEIVSAEINNSVFTDDLKDVDWEKLNKRKNLTKKPNISWLSVFSSVIIVTLGALYFGGLFDPIFSGKDTNKETASDNISEETNSNNTTSWLEQNEKSANEVEETQPVTAEEVITSAESTDTYKQEKAAVSTDDADQLTSGSDSANEMESNNDVNEANSFVDEVPSTETSENAAVESPSDASDPYLFIEEGATNLPEELEILIFASSNNLAPVRVQWDGLDQLRPYWVEVGQAMRVQFSNELRLRTLNYDRMILIFNGHPIGNLEEQFFSEENGLLIINRSFFERDSAFWIKGKTANADFEGLKRPSKIYDRPTF